MRRLLIALLFLFAAEAPALACSCLPYAPTGKQARAMADQIAAEAAALVEVDVLSGYDAATGTGERMRLRRLLAGQAPATFSIQRSGPRSNDICGLEYKAGATALLVIYPGRDGPSTRPCVFRESGLCIGLLLRDERLRQLLVDAFARRPRTPG